jgi:hypothetical protein
VLAVLAFVVSVDFKLNSGALVNRWFGVQRSEIRDS